jgi:acyl dehydratase
VDVAPALSFASAPSLWRAYLKIFFTRKPRFAEIPIPRIDAVLEGFRIDERRLAAYRRVCGEPPSAAVPIAYPHVLAMPLHLSILSSAAFPLNPLGVVHLRNRIVQQRPLRIGDSGEIHAHITGHGETRRGHELELLTQARVGAEVIWSESSTLLARAPRRTGPPQRPSTEEIEVPRGEARTSIFAVASSIGRRYARVSGDYNPIHLSTLSARLFGFRRAIAHGMWSLARCAADLKSTAFAAPCTLDVAFKLPIALPARLALESWSHGAATGFVLRDAQGARRHLLGRITRR